MTTRPDFSAAMLHLFLRARMTHALAAVNGAARRDAKMKAVRARWRRLSGLTHAQIDLAWMGRLNRAVPRARLWAVLGHFPADHGLVLTDDGGQEAAHG